MESLKPLGPFWVAQERKNFEKQVRNKQSNFTDENYLGKN